MKIARYIALALVIVMTAALLTAFALADGGQTAPAGQAEETESPESLGMKALAVCIAIGLAAAAGAIGMSIVGGKAEDAISRQPEMEDKIRTTLMLNQVFIETAIIYALLVVILVIFVL